MAEPAPLATWPELQARPGFGHVEEAEVTGLLADASAEVRDLVRPELDDVVPPNVPGSVRMVVVNMVRRGLDNPRGLAQESLGDYSYSTGGQGVATVYMTKREKRIVRRSVGKLGAGAIGMTGDLPTQISEVYEP